MDREQLIVDYIQSRSDLFDKDIRVLHTAYDPKVYEMLKNKQNIKYFASESVPYEQNPLIDLRDAPYKDDFFDVVIAIHVLEHIKEDNLAFKEIHRMLKKDGIAILQVPLSDSDTVEFEKKDESDHIRLYGKDFPQIIIKHGFDVDYYLPGGINKNEGLFIATCLK